MRNSSVISSGVLGAGFGEGFATGFVAGFTAGLLVVGLDVLLDVLAVVLIVEVARVLLVAFGEEATLIDFLVDFGADLTGDAVVLERLVTRPSIDLFLSIVYNYNIMGIKLTKKQLAVLNYLEDFTEENGYSPSYREIQAGLGLSSVSAVAEHIDNLVSKGVLKKVPGAARSLEILDYKHEETVKLFKAKLMDCSEEDKKILMAAGDVLGLDLD